MTPDQNTRTETTTQRLILIDPEPGTIGIGWADTKVWACAGCRSVITGDGEHLIVHPAGCPEVARPESVTAGWLHLADGTECVAGHSESTRFCAEDGGPVISGPDAVRRLGQVLAKLGRVRDLAEHLTEVDPGHGEALLAILDGTEGRACDRPRADREP